MRSLIRRLVPKPLRQARQILNRDDPGMSIAYKEDFFWRAFKTLAFNRIDGDYAEFGCHRGITFGIAWRESRRHFKPKAAPRLWAFDSFEGLPEQRGPADAHPEYIAGRMSTSLDSFHKICAGHGIPRNVYETVPGFYETSLRRFGPADAPANIAFAYIDCDYYSSTLEVIDFLTPRLKHGMIIAMDDYFCYSSSQVSGERRAMEERWGQHPRWAFLPYVQYGWAGMSYVVEDRRLMGGPA